MKRTLESGRSGGDDIGRVVRSAKLLCTKVVEIIKNLEQECMGSASLLINQYLISMRRTSAKLP